MSESCNILIMFLNRIYTIHHQQRQQQQQLLSSITFHYSFFKYSYLFFVFIILLILANPYTQDSIEHIKTATENGFKMVVSLTHSDDRRLATSLSFETVNQPSSSDRRLSDIVPSHPREKPSPSSSSSPTLHIKDRLSSAISSNLKLEQGNSLSNHVTQSQNQLMSSSNSTVPPSSPINPAGTQRSMFSNRTRSDDDCDYSSVVLRTKSSTSIVTPSHTAIPSFSTAKSKNPMDRSSSFPITPTDPLDTDDTGRNSPISRDIDHIRSFLESEYVAPTEDFWHLQRDSFIHRSYNKKLLARKNAIDAYESPKRPASMPAVAFSNRQPLLPLPTTDENQSLPQAVVKRDSFIRNSFNSLRRSFSIRTSSAKKKTAQTDRRSMRLTRALTDQELYDLRHNGCSNNKINNNREGFTVSDEGERWELLDTGGTTFLNVPLENVRNSGHSRNSSTSSCTSNR